MRRKHYIGVAGGIAILAGMISIYLFSMTGFSLAAILDPLFYDGLLGSAFLPMLFSLMLMGVSLGAMFSGARFLGRMQAVGFAGLCSLMVGLTGTLFFQTYLFDYLILSFGLILGASIAAITAGNARGSKFSIGFGHTKKALTVVAIVAFIGAWMMVAGNTDHYKDSFTSSITGLSAIGAADIDDATIEQLIKEKSPAKMSWSEYLKEIEIGDYNSLSLEHRIVVQGMYQNYSTEYDATMAAAIQQARKNLEGSESASELIIESVGFFQDILDNIVLIYAIALASMVLLAESIVVAPVAGITSFVFQYPLPKKDQPKPKGAVLKVKWTGE